MVGTDLIVCMQSEHLRYSGRPYHSSLYGYLGPCRVINFELERPTVQLRRGIHLARQMKILLWDVNDSPLAKAENKWRDTAEDLIIGVVADGIFLPFRSSIVEY